tara:strand:- start:1815 stop:2780 length:966 start_codon:yes stop_codon:yes gene_type:complete
MSEPGCLSSGRYDNLQIRNVFINKKKVTSDVILPEQSVIDSDDELEETVIYNDLNVESVTTETVTALNSVQGNTIVTQLPTIFVAPNIQGPYPDVDIGENSACIIETNYVYIDFGVTVRIKLTGTKIDQSNPSIIDVNLLTYEPIINNFDVATLNVNPITEGLPFPVESTLELYYRQEGTNYIWPLTKTIVEAELFTDVYFGTGNNTGASAVGPPQRTILGQNYYTSGHWSVVDPGIAGPPAGINHSEPPSTNNIVYNFVTSNVTRPIWTNINTQIPGMPFVYGVFKNNGSYELVINNIDKEVPLSGKLFISVRIHDLITI